jgi:spore germination cell wall hydrolase CwlJ-like protein
MGRFGRAAGVAVAGICLALGATFAAPSRAEEAATAASVAYTEHAATAPVLSAAANQDVIAELPKTGAAESDLPAPVASHAVATLDSAPVEQSQPQAAPRSLSELVADYASADAADDELHCLATAVYFESKSEPLAGQLAVAKVIINRTRSGRFPSTICGVVKQRGQFSFVSRGRLPAVSHGTPHWRTAVAIATIASQQLSESATAEHALYFHARRVSPGWRLTRVGVVGNHVFYR